MKSICSVALLLFACVLTSTAQTTVPFPTGPRIWNEISPWGYSNPSGIGWNTAPYLPFIYMDNHYRLMPPNGVTPTVTKNPDGTITNISFAYSEPGKKYPLILFFQGAGEVGTDNNKQLTHGGEIHKNAVLSNQFPGFLVYPQSVYIDQAKLLIDKLVATYPIDINRIYVHGLSNGAKWTWQFANAYPTLVAAMAPMSGVEGTDPELLYTPIRLAQGGLDKNPTPGYTQTIVNWFSTNGGHLEYFLFPTLGHGTWNSMYTRPDFFSWFLQFKKNQIQVLFNKSEYCVGDPVNTTMGFTPGFDAYEWRKDGLLMASETTHKITVTTLGSYTGRINNRGQWSEWSSAIDVKIKAPTVTPPIQLAQLKSVLLPDVNGISSVALTLPAGYETYSYSKTGVGIIGSTQSITVTAPGTYTATVKEFGGCSSNASVPFVIVDANGTPKPDPISNLQATGISRTQIRLTWDNTASPAVNETGFEIYRSLVSTGSFALISLTVPDVLTYTDNNLIANTTYYYKIRPVASAGAATASATISALTDVDLTPPTAPNNLAVTSTTQTNVGLSWSGSTDNVGVTGYDVFVRAFGQTNYLKAYTTTATTQLVAGLTPSTLYNFIVKAKDQAGNLSEASNQVNSATVLTGLNYSYYHGTWTNLPNFSSLTPISTGTVTNFSLTPRTQNDNFGFVFTGFLQITTNGSYTFYTASNDGSKLWVNNVLVVNNDGMHGVSPEISGSISLNAGFYPIRAEYFENNGSGESLTVSYQGPSVSKQVIPSSRLKENYTLPAAPAAPSNLSNTVVDYQSIRLNWNTYTGTGTNTEIYRSLNGTTWNIIATIPASQNLYVSSGLAASTRYYHRLRAVNSGNVSSFTSSVNTMTTALPPLPAAPTALQILNVAVTSATIKWTDASTNEDNFEVYKSLGNNSSYTKLATLPANTTQYIDNSLFAHTTYFYKVLSKNVRGSSAYSNEIQLTSLNTTPVISPVSDVTLRFDEERIIPIIASDADNDFLVYGATGLPAFAQLFDYGEGIAYLRIAPAEVLPAASNVGEYTGFQVSAQDSYGGIHTTQFKITVNSNHNPVVASIAAQTVKETNTLQFSVAATDEDNDAITWSVQNAPAFLTSVPSGNTVNVTLSPQTNHAGVYSISFVATDINGGTSSQIASITVEDYDPNYVVRVNFRTDATSNGPADWNNAGDTNNNTIIPTIALNKENGSSSGITMSSTGIWERWKDSGGVTPGVYPTNVNKSLLQSWGNTARTLKLQGLNVEGKYNLKFLSSATSGYETWANLTTTYTINSQSQSINARNNSSTLVLFNALTPNAKGEITISITNAPSNGLAILNAMVLESYYEGTTPPVAPSNLQVAVSASQAIQVTWNDNAGNEQSQELERSTDGINFVKIATLASDINIYADSNFEAGNTYSYRVKALNGNGSSPYSNTASILAPNRIPVILPINTISIPEMDMQWVEVVATDADNDVLTFTLENEPGFMWSEYVDDTRVNLVFAPSVGDKGTYQFLLHCDDDNGARKTATVNVTIYSATDIEFKINFTAASLAASPWNNITGYTTNTVLSGLKNSNNVITSASLTLMTDWNGTNPNGNNTGNNSGIYPDAVMSSSFFVQDNATRTILLAGLNPAKTYDFTFFASRMGVVDVRNTVYSIGAKSAVLNASGNTSNTAKLIGIKPAANGSISISIAKEAASQFGYLGAMVIREYETIVVPTVPEKPLSLLSQVLTRTSVKLNWQDASSDETGFQIWRSVGNNANYSLVTTVGTGVTTYTNTGLTTSTLYYYKVAAVNAVGPSPYSNETSGSTFDFSVSVNFYAFNGPAAGWNNITGFQGVGYLLNNLLDDSGNNSGISMTIVEGFASSNPWGNVTGNNSGIVPDRVMEGSFWIDQGGRAVLRFGGLSFLKKYNFSFFASRAGDGDRNTVYTINSTSVVLNAAQNTTNLVQIKDITPDPDGTITVTISTTQTALFGYLNGLIIQAVPNTGGTGRVGSNKSDETLPVDDTDTIEPEMQAFPNPFKDRITLQLGSEAVKEIRVSLVNAAGIEVFAGQFDRQPEVSEFELILNEELSAGLYILRVIEDSGVSHVLKMIKR